MNKLTNNYAIYIVVVIVRDNEYVIDERSFW
jgi:hypothetical protein